MKAGALATGRRDVRVGGDGVLGPAVLVACSGRRKGSACGRSRRVGLCIGRNGVWFAILLASLEFVVSVTVRAGLGACLVGLCLLLCLNARGAFIFVTAAKWACCVFFVNEHNDTMDE